MQWIDFPPLAKVGIISAAVLTAGLAAVAVALSYDAAYHLVLAHGHYSAKAAKVYPLILDAGFLIAEFAAIVAVALRPLAPDPRKISRYPFGPLTIMTICAVGSIWINILHAGSDKVGMLIAALPPVLMILAFNVLVAICRWTSHLMGFDPGEIPPVREVPGRLAAQIRRPTSPQAGQTGHLSVAEFARAKLRLKSDTALARTTDSSVMKELKAEGITMDRSWASKALAEVKSERGISTNGNHRR
ncbi:MAG TPA: DUF2637 domain-containing protein [Actinomycetes bacterium]|jgi:hypothetical protein|nr:DUF2637 domain-containing protein [Actinomycetes bacterium]